MKLAVKRSRQSILVGMAVVCMATLSNVAHAGLFDDEEARKAILELRKESRERADALTARIDRLEAAQRNSLELSNQIQILREEISRLRGTIESLTKELADTQKRQKDLYTDLDGRLKKVEPQSLSLDGKEVSVDQTEKRSYDEALAVFRTADYKGAVVSLANFVRTYPRSPLAANAQFYLGNSYYGLKDFRNAIAMQQVVLRSYADSPRVPDALLTIAASQLELNDRKAARKTLETLVAEHPQSGAAATARDRLTAMK